MRQNKDVCSLEGLSGCPLLEAITVTECSLESMDGMEECSRVQRLNLSSNKITRISGLGAMTEVTQIWMNDNRITRLDGLSHLTNLSVRAAGVCAVLALFKCKTLVFYGHVCITGSCARCSHDSHCLSCQPSCVYAAVGDHGW